jgi:hypothetical protein
MSNKNKDQCKWIDIDLIGIILIPVWYNDMT